MKDALAERLLAKLKIWSSEDEARERLDLLALATYKYDEYQQFSPGMRFMESLARWLEQFDNEEERRIAYNFVRERLIFISASEMAHLVTMSYPSVIRPLLVEQVALKKRIPEWYANRIINSQEFRVLLRQSLFLALSDGSHIDLFRRRNKDISISHEQILRTTEISTERASEMLRKLEEDLTEILGRPPSSDEARFHMVFLLDDFSASGVSYIREEEKQGEYGGKIATFLRNIQKTENAGHPLMHRSETRVCLVLYIATQCACERLEKLGKMMLNPLPFTVRVVNLLPDAAKLDEQRDKEFLGLAAKYYDNSIETPSYLKGRHEKPYLGFDQCALPLVMSHNTPNNAVTLLWLGEHRRYCGLFPRIDRF